MEKKSIFSYQDQTSTAPARPCGRVSMKLRAAKETMGGDARSPELAVCIEHSTKFYDTARYLNNDSFNTESQYNTTKHGSLGSNQN
jgi:hypothetical protein